MGFQRDELSLAGHAASAPSSCPRPQPTNAGKSAQGRRANPAESITKTGFQGNCVPVESRLFLQLPINSGSSSCRSTRGNKRDDHRGSKVTCVLRPHSEQVTSNIWRGPPALLRSLRPPLPPLLRRLARQSGQRLGSLVKPFSAKSLLGTRKGTLRRNRGRLAFCQCTWKYLLMSFIQSLSVLVVTNGPTISHSTKSGAKRYPVKATHTVAPSV